MKYIVLAASLVLCAAVSASAFQGYVLTNGNATIAWGDGSMTVEAPVVASGDGLDPAHDKALAVRRAAVSARKGLLDVLSSVRILGKLTVGQYMAKERKVGDKVRRLVHNSRFDRPVSMDGNGAVKVYEALRGPLLAMLFPKTVQFQTGVPLTLGQLVTARDANASVTPTDVMAASGTYTGLIVDARGIKVVPALIPVIYGDDGLGVYGPFSVSRAAALKHGLVAYASTDDMKILEERVGSNPLTAKVLRPASHGTGMVISSENSVLARTLLSDQSVADGCKVVILIDAPKNVDAAKGGE